jgi:DNA helicase HerA-like ATPase
MSANTFRLPQKDLDVVERIIAPAAPQQKRGQTINEGYRFICLGETGSGKTSLMRVVVYYTLEKGYANFALIHDTKGIFAEYPRSLQLASVVEFRGFNSKDLPVVSFRGDPRRDVVCTAEEVALLSKQAAQRGIGDGEAWRPNPHLLVIEEMAAAASAGRKQVEAPSVLWAAEQGRKVSVSLVGTTQSPRKTPLDILGQATSIAFFRLTGADANYLGERLDLDPRLISAIRGPNSEGLPNRKFALYLKGEPWDGQIYELDKRTALMFE